MDTYMANGESSVYGYTAVQASPTSVHPHINDSPYTIHVAIYYTIMLVFLQQTSWWWTFKGRNM